MEAIAETPVNKGNKLNQATSGLSLGPIIPKTMKAAVIREFGAPLQIEEVKVKLPNDNQILVKVITCGVCHTDLHAINGDWPVKPQLPLIPGHEAVGYVGS